MTGIDPGVIFRRLFFMKNYIKASIIAITEFYALLKKIH